MFSIRSALQVFFIVVALHNAPSTLRAQQQEHSPNPNLPGVAGGYVLFDIDGTKMELERAWSTTDELPPFYYWKKQNVVVKQWHVNEGQLLFYRVRDLKVSTNRTRCRRQIVSLATRTREASYPGDIFVGERETPQKNRLNYLREFVGPLTNGTPLSIGARYFFLTAPELLMSNGRYPASICGIGELSSCIVSFEIRYPLFATYRYSHNTCGLEGLVEVTVAIKRRLLSRLRD
ncbi:hypothetical protein MRS76_12380 [Rhizobiaceae bacterium n13]|uniref:Uncharacterized protein n=1 Tax=Ferirhizobium litorale TaxID=2927786 RepID=A0AAE3QIX2_9HYPH|nr:hypothetical protein [Fererhizobium litorale]MDI7862756.1 hypothetical protein [Fererhizobium litorale]MDI7924380.1 hypothetical protein [Fererhizobium litorale]